MVKDYKSILGYKPKNLNEIPYEEGFSFEDIAKHELKSYEETELAWT